MTSKLLSVLVASAATFVATSAAAHVDMMTPPMRGGDQKVGPCEGEAAGTPVELTAGDTYNVTWNETIQHPGHFRIAIRESGEDFPTSETTADFDDIMGNGVIMVESVPDGADDQEAYDVEITVPDVNCDNCVLQIVQVMTTAAAVDLTEDLYFRCGDLRITGASGEGGAGAGGGSGSGNGGSSSGEGGSGNSGNNGSGAGSDGGSSSNGAGSGASAATPGGASGETHDCAVRAVGASSPASSLAMALGLGAMVSLAAARRRRRSS